jgi:hypothetical protein
MAPAVIYGTAFFAGTLTGATVTAALIVWAACSGWLEVERSVRPRNDGGGD